MDNDEKKAREDAISRFEESCNIIALLFGGGAKDERDEQIRKVALKARGDIRELLGEARS